MNAPTYGWYVALMCRTQFETRIRDIILQLHRHAAEGMSNIWVAAGHEWGGEQWMGFKIAGNANKNWEIGIPDIFLYLWVRVHHPLVHLTKENNTWDPKEWRGMMKRVSWDKTWVMLQKQLVEKSQNNLILEQQLMPFNVTQIPVNASDAITGHKLQGLAKD